MGKTLTCPFCNNKDTLKVVYCYRGYKRKKDDLSNLVKDGTIYRNEKPRFEKYDFDGEKITATLYNKYCPNWHNDVYRETQARGNYLVACNSHFCANSWLPFLYHFWQWS